MPNWCENKLTIRGKKENLINFLKQHYVVSNQVGYDDYLDFKTIIPEPKTPDECEPAYVIPAGEDRHLQLIANREWFDWYSWHCHNWGTKWNSTNGFASERVDTLIKDFSEITICFDTAWSPCIPIINKIIQMYPDLLFEYVYFEPGMLFAGKIFYDDNGDYYEQFFDNYDELKQFCIEQEIICPLFYDELEKEDCE